LGFRPGLNLPVRVGLGVFSGIAQAFPNFDAPLILPLFTYTFRPYSYHRAMRMSVGTNIVALPGAKSNLRLGFQGVSRGFEYFVAIFMILCYTAFVETAQT
jgi:hypothetical protein